MENVVMSDEIRKQMLMLAEEKYKKFSASLLPGTENILGVRLPILRKMAVKIAAEDWRTFLLSAQPFYFEEVMLRGMIIGSVKGVQAEERLNYIAQFIPLINNWSVCDSFCSGLKFTKDNREIVWKFLQSYLQAFGEYEVRFAVVMILNYYLSDDYLEQVFACLGNIHHEGYYVKMAVAWAVSQCYVKNPLRTLQFMKSNCLGEEVYRRSIRKICESHKVSKQEKEKLISL